MLKVHRFARCAVFATALLGAAAAAEPSPTGVWIDDQGRGGIEIKDCAGKLCGHLVWFKDSAELKNCGKQILGDVAPVGSNTWDNGWIYDPDKKQKFDLELKPLSGDKLQVKGYAGMKFLSKTMVWKRAPASLARCDGAKADSAAAAPAEATEAPPAQADSATDRATAPPLAGVAPADPPPPAASGRTARANTAPAEPDEEDSTVDEKSSGGDVAAKGGKKDCKLEVPYITLTFPCPE